MRKVKVKRRTGELEEVEQYYHHYVVALLLGPVLDVVLGIEPVLNEEARRDIDPEHVGHEGELTAARRLIDSLHDTYAGFIDAFVLDALYANGPVMTQLTDYGYGGSLVLKKEKNEPLKDARTLWEIEGRCESYEDPERKEHVEFWDVDDIETLTSYKGKIRAVRAVVTQPGEDPSTGASPSSGSARASSVAGRRYRSSVLVGISKTPRFINGSNIGTWPTCFGIRKMRSMSVLLLWTLAFNLFQLFLYRRLGRCRRPKDPTATIRHIVEVMLRKVALLPSRFLGRLFCSTPVDAAPARANWAARTHRPPTSPHLRCGRGGSLTKTEPAVALTGPARSRIFA